MSRASDPSPTPRTGPRGSWLVLALTGLGALVVGLRALMRYGARVGWWGSGSSGSASGALRPFGAIEDGAARLLAKYLVEPARAGEGLTPTIRYEHGWPQWAFLLVVGGSIALIVWLYRREGGAPAPYRALLAGLRILAVLLAMFLLSEAVLSVERTGLPTFVILADDSASGQIVDQYGETRLQDEARVLSLLAGREQPDRLGVGLGWLLRDDARLLRDLARQQKVKLYRLSEAPVPVAEIDKPEEVAPALEALKGLKPTGAQSRLGDGVKAVLDELRGTPPTAILLLSDGQTTDGARLAEAAEQARKEGVPLYTIGLGDVEPARDLELADLQVDEVAFVNDVIRFEARLLARGFVDPKTPARPGAGPQVNVLLKRSKPGSADLNALETVQTVRVPIPPDGKPQKIEISDRPTETGPIRYVVEVEAQPRELQAENNKIERTVDVRDEKLKVLLVEGQPRWEFRYLKTYLERDETIALSVVLQSADELYAEQDRSALGAFPPGKEGQGGLYDYDVVILGDVDPTFLNAQQTADLVQFVTEKGGGLFLVAGELFNPLSFKGKPLEPLLPILLSGARNPSANGQAVEAFQPVLTPEGRAHPIFRLGDDEAASLKIWESLPPSNWYFEAPQAQPTAVVLAEHPTKTGPGGRLPLLLYQYAGSGKVFFSALDDTWRWRLRVGDRYFGRYWVQAIRFLARSKLVGQKQVELATDRRRYRRGQPGQVQVRFPNPALAQDLKTLTVELSRAGQPPQAVSLRPAPGTRSRNLFEGSLPTLAEGPYEVRLQPIPGIRGDLPTARFLIDPPAGEFDRVEMDREDLAAAATLTGGQFFRWDEKTKRVAAPARTDRPASEASGAGPDDTPRAPGSPTEGPASGTELADRSLLDLLPAPQKVPLDTDPPIPLWSTWPAFGLLLGTLGLEWVLRKRKQLV